MVKKLSVNIDYSDEYAFIGIACHLKDYRLSFYLNKALDFKLKKIDDFNQLDERLESHPYSVFYYYCPDFHSTFCLLSNHHADMKLIPSLKQFDYFLVFQKNLNAPQKQELIRKIKKVPNMIMAYEIDYTKMNKVNYLITDLELQLIENIKK